MSHQEFGSASSTLKSVSSASYEINIQGSVRNNAQVGQRNARRDLIEQQINNINHQSVQYVISPSGQVVPEPQGTPYLQCLSSNYEEQKDFNPRRCPGTCEWFSKDQRFRDWLASQNSSLLWLSADPGCGKSVLSRWLIDDGLLSATTSAPCCYFFFKDGLERRMKASDALAAILHRLLVSVDPTFSKHTHASFNNHGTSLRNMFKELWSVFLKTVQDIKVGEIFCVIDALDECEKFSREMLMDAIIGFFIDQRAAMNTDLRLKILITSRPYTNVRNLFRTIWANTSFMHFDGAAESRAISRDINLVIEMEVPRIAPDLPLEAQRKIIDRLKQTEQRTYLWLYLMIDEIQNRISAHNTAKKLERLISRLPVSVFDAYAALLKRSEDPEKTRLLLQIVVSARRPLTVGELNVALEIAQSLEDEDCNSYDALDLEPDDTFALHMKSFCGLLVTVQDSKVYLLHQTVREFLLNPPAANTPSSPSWCYFSEDDSNFLMTRVSLKHLQFDDMLRVYNELTLSSNPDEDDIFDGLAYDGGLDRWISYAHHAKHILLTYTAQFWPDHCRHSHREAWVQIWTNVKQICDGSAGLWLPFCAEVGVYKHQSKINSITKLIECTPLALASMLGLLPLVEKLVAEGADVDGRKVDPRGQYEDAAATPLCLAVLHGHREVVAILLDSGVDVKARSWKGDGPLHIASFTGRGEIVELLLNRGADINIVGHEGTALQLAWRLRNFEIVKLLVQMGADIDVVFKNGTVLHEAVVWSEVTLVKLLLDGGADINAIGPQGTALQVASFLGSPEMVNLLLEMGADIDIVGPKGTALHLAIEWNRDDIVRILLDSGADTNVIGPGGAALQLASSKDDLEIIELLLRTGADTDTVGPSGTALQIAARRGEETIVQTLLDGGANVNVVGPLGTVLDIATWTRPRSDTIIRLLLQYGARHAGKLKSPATTTFLTIPHDPRQLERNPFRNEGTVYPDPRLPIAARPRVPGIQMIPPLDGGTLREIFFLNRGFIAILVRGTSFFSYQPRP